MKTLKFIAALFVVSILTAGTSVFAEELTKEFKQEWSVDGVSTLEISNRYGEVRVNNEGGSMITVDVLVTVEGSNEKRLNELLDKIEVEFRKNGSTAKAETKIEGNLKGQNKLSIDYVINIPSDKNLNIENKYGNTVVGELTGNGNFVSKYGNFTAYDLATPEDGTLKLSLAYGNASIGSASYLNADVSYSPITIEEVKKLKVESKYSSINVEEADDIQAISKYDKYNCEEVGSFTADTKYTQIRIEELSKSLKIGAGYGGVRVSQIAKDFEFISITNSYGQISLGLDDADYSIDASCDYCGISYPEDEFSGDRIKENNSRTVKGKIGTGEGGKVMIKSRYGEIKLRD